MKQRGRKSAASLLAFPTIDQRSRLTPPSSLNKAERLEFAELAASAQHLKQSDIPLLASLAQAIIVSRRAARDPSKAAVWERATRMQIALARSLRLTPQSRTDSRAIGRQQPPTGPAPWE